MKFEIPRPMKLEHDELHADLVNATKAGGKTGDAATAVAKVLHSHFIKEEEYALPRAVAELVGNEGGVVSGVINLESSGVEASDWRPRHDEHYHEA